MHSWASLTHSYLRSKGYIESFFIAKTTDNPLSNEQLFGTFIGRNRQELYFVLLITASILNEVAHFRVPVFDLTTTFCNQLHRTHAEVITLREGRTLVISMLIISWKNTFIIADNIVFQLSHCMELHACNLLKGCHSLAKSVLGWWCERVSITIKEWAEHTKSRYFWERINECCWETRHNIKVTTSRSYKAEKWRSVHTFTTG